MDLQHPMFSPDGYIIDQHCAVGIPYGACMSDYNGCGWMAAYNVLHACGSPVSAEAVRAELEKGLWFGGRLGTGPFRMARYLRRQGLRVRCRLHLKGTPPGHKPFTAGLVMYWTGWGTHFVAFAPEGNAHPAHLSADSPLHFFNAVCGNAHHCATLRDFLHTHSRAPVCLLLTAHSAALPAGENIFPVAAMSAAEKQ